MRKAEKAAAKCASTVAFPGFPCSSRVIHAAPKAWQITTCVTRESDLGAELLILSRVEIFYLRFPQFSQQLQTNYENTKQRWYTYI